ncbi:hypothetical protein [Flavobacterium caseinilyticum]|uniref:hypothetical protein n=1 Tax=Flavobacterium caseinilyticum TaxID=2541732 RepID=UPI001404A782|nr:hypothetical protein [Flavobacterium caseinilyticum]
MENSSYEAIYHWESYCRVGKTSSKTNWDEEQITLQDDGKVEDLTEPSHLQK